MDERILHIQHCMYQYSRAIYRSIKDLIDPYVDDETHLEYRREVLAACEGTMERLAADPHYFAKPDRALFQDIRRYFPITVQAQVAWAVHPGRRGRGRVRRGADRGGSVRRRRRTVPRDDAQGQGLPAHTAARTATTAPRTSISSAAKPPRKLCVGSAASGSSGRRRKLAGEPRHRQADPPALAGRVPDGRTPAADGAGHQVERRGLPGDERRGVRAPLLLRPRRARLARRPARLAARRVHRRGAVHAALRAVLPAGARARRRGARRAADVLLPPRGPLRVRRAAAPRAAEPGARPLGGRARRGADRHRRPRRGARPRLLAGAAGPPRQARRRDLEAAHGQVPLLVDLRATRSASARSTRTRCCPRTARGT